ncbi:MAG TPA: hypothetical protein VJZ71_09880 [Phycisphaerae bacterium]|nr:hypothetical protein [Phycisphaerae bacterium]
MSIQRDERGIHFHELGTLHSVTRWISTHPDGLAEWLKNVRRAYQADRANVAEEHRVAVILMRDSSATGPAALGMLDVGGATLEDVSAWSTWQDFTASSRGSGVIEEQTQGNGAKAYMYRLFGGRARILGIRDTKLNCKGFEGAAQSLERGIPGFIPDVAAGRELPVDSWQNQLRSALETYQLRHDELPPAVLDAIHKRRAFTLVEGLEPKDLYKGRIPEDLVQKLLRHDQATAAIEQLRIYAVHNGRILNDGNPLRLETIETYPGFETARVHEIPETLKDDEGVLQSTTFDGKKPKGRLILYTSRENMLSAYKKLKPRWKITYKANPNHIIGSKPVSDLAPAVPGSYFIYGTVELAALEPDYVSLGRLRPNDGPLVSALDRFITDHIKDLAKEINERRRQELDDQTLDEVQRENRVLDRFKNQFLESSGPSGPGDDGNGEGGKKKRKRKRVPHEYGDTPESIEFDWDTSLPVRIGCGVVARMVSILKPRVVDAAGRLVPRAELEWITNDRHVVQFRTDDQVVATGKGKTQVSCRVRGTTVSSSRVDVEVWTIDHVLLTPRALTIPLGKRGQITAQVTNDDGIRATNVLLNWTHDAADPLIVLISPWGWVNGNRLGRTSISAGAGEEISGGVWARIRAEVEVTPNPEAPERGGGFPKLLVTDRDIDPFTGEIRASDDGQPTLYQEVWDYQSNVWWLNLGSPEAAFFFKQRADNPRQWRAFHSQKVIEMVVQVHMMDEYDTTGDERPDLWSRHKNQFEIFQVQFMQAMWEKLQPYIFSGIGLE